MKDIFLLDMDETLLDFPRAEEANFSATLETFGISPSGLYARFHDINDGLWKKLERGEIDRKRLSVLRFELLFGEAGIRADAAAVARAYMENFGNVCFPYEGASDFLEELSARGRVYLVTNGSAHIQRQHMRDAGFLPYLSGAFISEEIGENKPSKAYADYVKAHIPNFSERRAVWIGDSLTSDMVCAKNAEVDFILYAPAGGGEGLFAARNYREALELIERLS